jgi:hypothetical protein
MSTDALLRMMPVSPSKDERRAFLRTGREAAERQQYGKTGGHAPHGTDRPQSPQSRFPVRLSQLRKRSKFLRPGSSVMRTLPLPWLWWERSYSHSASWSAPSVIFRSVCD